MLMMQQIAEVASIMYHIPGMPPLVDAARFKVYMARFRK
jgi:hypothetical protein